MKIVIFDMDGTLIDSAQDITTTINHVRRVNHRLPPLSSEEVVEIINRPVRNLAKLFYGTESYEMRDKTLFESHYYDQCTQNPRLYPQIEEMIVTLRAHDVKLSVATNALLCASLIFSSSFNEFVLSLLSPPIPLFFDCLFFLLHHDLELRTFAC